MYQWRKLENLVSMLSEEIVFFSLFTLCLCMPLENISAFTSLLNKQREGRVISQQNTWMNHHMCAGDQVIPPGVKNKSKPESLEPATIWCVTNTVSVAFPWTLWQNMCCWNKKLVNIEGRYCEKGVNSSKDLWWLERCFVKNNCIIWTKQCVGVEEQLQTNVLLKMRK